MPAFSATYVKHNKDHAVWDRGGDSHLDVGGRQSVSLVRRAAHAHVESGAVSVPIPKYRAFSELEHDVGHEIRGIES